MRVVIIGYPRVAMKFFLLNQEPSNDSRALEHRVSRRVELSLADLEPYGPITYAKRVLSETLTALRSPRTIS